MISRLKPLEPSRIDCRQRMVRSDPSPEGTTIDTVGDGAFWFT
jgi:hypothetical protein